MQGATGFVGKLVCQRLAQLYQVNLWGTHAGSVCPKLSPPVQKSLHAWLKCHLLAVCSI